MKKYKCEITIATKVTLKYFINNLEIRLSTFNDYNKNLVSIYINPFCKTLYCETFKDYDLAKTFVEWIIELISEGRKNEDG